jgi:CheY-like chemotaxis protein
MTNTLTIAPSPSTDYLEAGDAHPFGSAHIVGNFINGLRVAGPALFLLEAMMPDMVGFEIVALLKADPRMKPVPVIMSWSPHSKT